MVLPARGNPLPLDRRTRQVDDQRPTVHSVVKLAFSVNALSGIVVDMKDEPNKIEVALRSLPDLTDDQRKAITKILSVICNYGAGCALSGLMAENISRATLTRVAELLRLSWRPNGGGLVYGPDLLDQKSEVAEITELLSYLDKQALSGEGVPYVSS